MRSDSISNASRPGFAEEQGKKKRMNRIAKLRQRKLDVRREQWLSQIKNREHGVNTVERGGCPRSYLQISDEGNRLIERAIENLENSRGVDIGKSNVHESDLESVMGSPICSSLDQKDSIKDLRGSSCSSVSSVCSSGRGSEAEEDDGCVDNWEAVADALTAAQNQHNSTLESSTKYKTKVGLDDPKFANKSSGVNLVKTDGNGMVPTALMNSRAWLPYDASRPQSLPNLSKQHGLTENSVCGAITWEWESIDHQPSPCPICCEDLDLTDSSFLPCSCGFQLCLFCHKRILETDARCPGCRKQYDTITGNVGFNARVTVAQCFNMNRS